MGPSLEDIRRNSAERFLFDKNGPPTSETTPASIDNNVKRFADTLAGDKPAFVPVIEDKHGIYMWCNDGVYEKVKADGGSPVFGWAIWEWPKIMFTAEFHTVWQDDNGNLFDITPKPKGEKQILFVADRSYKQDFNFDNRPGNRRMRIYNAENREDIAKLKISNLLGKQLEYENKRAQQNGLTLQEWILKKIPTDPLPGIIDQFIKDLEEQQNYMDAISKDGQMPVDARLIDLTRRAQTTLLMLKKLSI